LPIADPLHSPPVIPALLGALLIGLSLGLLGSGGSILTVPVLVFLLRHPEKTAITESLGIVGGIALTGAIANLRRRLVDLPAVAFFGLPGLAGVWLGSQLARHVSGTLQLAIFAAIMLLAAAMMLRRRADDLIRRPRRPFWAVALIGLLVGAITGLVGIGGGFLIVPALSLLARLPMRIAIGTSLCIIALNGLTGFAIHLTQVHHGSPGVDWITIGLFIAVGSLGSLAGGAIGARLSQLLLRRLFAVFLLLMGGFILARQIAKMYF
jgi:uncharacterized membrane protein YfcA